MHWCYVYFGLQYADSSLYGYDEENDLGTVTWHGDLIANYVFDDELQMPIFTNIKFDWAEHTQTVYLEGLRSGKKEEFESRLPSLK